MFKIVISILILDCGVISLYFYLLLFCMVELPNILCDKWLHLACQITFFWGYDLCIDSLVCTLPRP